MNETLRIYKGENKDEISKKLDKEGDDVELLKRFLPVSDPIHRRNSSKPLKEIAMISDSLLVTNHEGWAYTGGQFGRWYKDCNLIDVYQEISLGNFRRTRIVKKESYRSSNWSPIESFELIDAKVTKSTENGSPLDVRVNYNLCKYYPNPSFEPGSREKIRYSEEKSLDDGSFSLLKLLGFGD